MKNYCNPTISIYIAYHKPAIIIENEIMKPIQSGKKKSKVDLGIIGDDTGDNISELGDSLNELTILYWMWKNDHAHEYLGLCHYRRIFIFNPYLIKKIPKEVKKTPYLFNDYERKYGWSTIDVINTVKGADIIVTRYWDSPIGRTHGEQYILYHGKEAYLYLINGVKTYAPDYYPFLMKCLNGKKLILGNMFVMRRDLLNEYCNWLFPLLKKIQTEIDPKKVSSYNIRQGFNAERLFHAYIEKLKFDRPELKILHYPYLLIEDTSRGEHSVPLIMEKTPIISLVYLCTNDLFPFFCVQIESLKSVISPNCVYDIIILSEEISEKNKRLLSEQIAKVKNIRIRFFDTRYILRTNEIISKFYEDKTCYIKIKLSSIFLDYDKILLLIPNILFYQDPLLIFQEIGDESYAAVVRDLKIMENRLLNVCLGKPYSKFTYSEYFEKIVSLSEEAIENYFNSDIMLLNLKKIRSDHLENNFMKCFKEKSFFFRDQDIFNKAFDGRITYLPHYWNVVSLENKRSLPVLPDFYEQEYQKSLQNPAIIQVAIDKRFSIIQENSEYFEAFWKYARKSPFYEKLLKQYVNHPQPSKLIKKYGVCYISSIKILGLLISILRKKCHNFFGFCQKISENFPIFSRK